MKRIWWLIVLMVLRCVGCNSVKNDRAMTCVTVSSQGPVLTLTVTPMLSPTKTSTPVPSCTSTPIPTLTPTPTGTPTPCPDKESPVLTLFGESVIKVIARSEYIEPGFIAEDEVDGDLTGQVRVIGEVDVNRCGTYSILYEVSDQSGNIANVQRTITVEQPKTVMPEGKVIYLTFDDGPGKYTEELLTLLEKYKVKATFFTCGNGRPDLVTKIHESGHTVGIHCKSHDYEVVYASEEAYFKDLFAMQDFIYECTGIRTTLVRFPGGSSNKVSSFNPGIMTRLTEELTNQGFQYFDWNVSSGDSGTTNTAKILDNLQKGIRNKDCCVVLQHPETRGFSLAALEEFIVWAMEKGYTFLTLDATSPGMHHSVNN